MAIIKTLKDFLTKATLYPITKTQAVYDDTVGRLDSYLQNTLGAEPIDNVEEELPELRDADTLGGRYTAEDLDAMPKSTAIEDYANIEPPITDADRLGGKYTAKDIDKIKQDITGLNSSLNANSNQFHFDYQDGKYGYNTDPNRGADTFHPFSSPMPYFVFIRQWVDTQGDSIQTHRSTVVLCTKNINTITIETVGKSPDWHISDCPLIQGGNQINDDYSGLINAVEIGKYKYNEGGIKSFDCTAYDYIAITYGTTTTISDESYRVVSWT